MYSISFFHHMALEKHTGSFYVRTAIYSELLSKFDFNSLSVSLQLEFHCSFSAFILADLLFVDAGQETSATEGSGSAQQQSGNDDTCA